MTERYLDPFLAHRKEQEKKHVSRMDGDDDPFSSLMIVEMNITELCNRTCVFCPRVDPNVYPNRNIMMDLKIPRKVARDLADVGYRGRISFSGYGECLLNKDFEAHIQTFRAQLPNNTIETNSNGDKLTIARIKSLFEAGLSALYINLYDGPEQAEAFHALFAEAGIKPPQYKLRPHWVGSEQGDTYGLTLNNRSGNIDTTDMRETPLELPLKNRCHYPFYKLFIDWDGRTLFCSNDWGRNIPVANVLEHTVRDIWLSEKFKKIRQRLSAGDRAFTPCDKCDVWGTMVGHRSHDILMASYEREEIESTAELSDNTIQKSA
jgi:MoaA/NifB/PqqE/SkfB family radical SAM enzyme